MSTTTKKTIETKENIKETLLTPRFYTTDFEEISKSIQIYTYFSQKIYFLN